MSLVERRAAVDAALILTIVIWAVNFSVVKLALAHLAPLPFNTLRLTGASLLLVVLTRLVPAPPLRREDWPRLVVVAWIGHTGYQLLFIFSVNETTASNAAILLGLTPVFVALLSSWLKVERTGPRTWAGIVLSILGVYFVVEASGRTGGSALGDALALAACFCWAVYTVSGQPLVLRYGLFKANAYLLAVGTLFFLPVGVPSLASVSFSEVPAETWYQMLFSMVFALVVAYSCWYFAVARVGPTQTAIYSNLMPVIAVAVAHLWLDEPIVPRQILGAAAIVFGIYLVRQRRREGGGRT